MGLLFASLSKDPRKRMEALEKILAVDPRNDSLGMRLGSEAERAKLPGAAAAAYEGVLAGNADHAGALKALCRSLRELGDIRGAIEVIEKAVQKHPRDQEAQRLRKDLAAEGYAMDAGFATARTTHDLLRDKDHTRRLEKQQRLVQDEVDLDARAEACRAAAVATPGEITVWKDLGEAEFALRRYDEAEAAFEKACGMAPNDVALRTRLGDIRIARDERAAREAREAADKGDAAARSRLPSLERVRNETLVTEYAFRVQSLPSDLALRFAFGGHLETAGRIDEALAEYQYAVKDPRRRGDALGAMGRCFFAKGMYDLAASQIEKGLQESSGSPDRIKSLHYDLAKVREKQGDAAGAANCLKKIYEVDIGYRDVAAWLERLGASAGGK
jgi:tetratricopeptide (TPR) repeat protein